VPSKLVFPVPEYLKAIKAVPEYEEISM